MLTGLNHITLAVTDLEQSFGFYADTLNLTPRARWKQGAYLSLGDLWLCLSLDNARPAGDYTHIAFTVSQADFASWRERLTDANAQLWKQNTSEGDSIYFHDPDGHKLELHSGSLDTRLASIAVEPYEDLQLFD